MVDRNSQDGSYLITKARADVFGSYCSALARSDDHTGPKLRQNGLHVCVKCSNTQIWLEIQTYRGAIVFFKAYADIKVQ